MAIWDKLKDGIDRANKVAQEALDEGKTRMEARRVRQAADAAAQSLGYAVFRAWENGRELEAESLDRLARALRDHEQEAARLEEAAQQAADWRRRQDAPGATDAPRGASANADSGAAGDTGATGAEGTAADAPPAGAPDATSSDRGAPSGHVPPATGQAPGGAPVA